MTSPDEIALQEHTNNTTMHAIHSPNNAGVETNAAALFHQVNQLEANLIAMDSFTACLIQGDGHIHSIFQCLKIKL